MWFCLSRARAGGFGDIVRFVAANEANSPATVSQNACARFCVRAVGPEEERQNVYICVCVCA